MWSYLEVIVFSLMAVPGGQRAKLSVWWSMVIPMESSLCVLSTPREPVDSTMAVPPG